jgi:hypothetical protein
LEVPSHSSQAGSLHACCSSLLELPSSPSGENGRAKVAERQTRLTADQLYPGSIPGLGLCLFRYISSV